MKQPTWISGIDFLARKKGWLRWRKGAPKTLTCPACSQSSIMTTRLDTASPAHHWHRFALYECSNCQTGHFPNLKPPTYEGKTAKAGERIRETAALKYYLEQGAGLISMIEPILRLQALPQRSFLEIGCGYGFAMHFAREALGWDVTGFDPSSLARVGAEDLGLEIQAQYLDAHTALNNGPFDIVYSSEVIEHVNDPDGFLAPIVKVLARSGILVLSTPDIGGIHEDRPLESLLPLVSPGSHLILFSKSGLEQTLTRAGFSNVEVVRNGDTLFAIASTAPLQLIEPSAINDTLFENYLAKQTKTFKTHPQLFTGFAGRLLKQQVNAAKYQAAERTFDQLTAHWRTQYKLDLGNVEQIVLPNPQTIKFETFAKQVPLNLSTVLYHAGVLALNRNQDISLAKTRFEACILADTALQTAFHSINVVDLESRILAGLAEALCIGLSANDNPATAADRLSAATECGILAECKLAFFNAELDVFSAAANTGVWNIARPFATKVSTTLQQKEVLDTRERTAATGLAMLALNHDFDRKTGLFWLNKALPNAPAGSPWDGLRTVWADHAAAFGTELLVDGGRSALAVHEAEIRDALLAREPKLTDLDVLVALGHIHQKSDPVLAIMWFLRAVSVAAGETHETLLSLITDTRTQGFLEAVATNKTKLATSLRADTQQQAIAGNGPPTLLFALGLDDLNRNTDPVSAASWFAQTAQISEKGELRDLACFHHALSLARAGEHTQARNIADKLFAEEPSNVTVHPLHDRRQQLEAEINEEPVQL